MEAKTIKWGRLVAAILATLALIIGYSSLTGMIAPAHADPAYGNIDQTTGTIIVHKHANQSGTSATQNPDGTGTAIPSDPIADVHFTVYHITDVNLGTAAGWSTVNGWATTAPTINTTGATPTVAGLTTTSADVLDPTNEAGVATSDSLPVGAYVVVETSHPANVTTSAAPFVVTIPTPYNNGWVYNVNVYPKNEVSPLTPTKSITSQDHLGLGSTAEFPVTTPIRNLADPTNFSHYWVQDLLDSRLTGGRVSSVTIDGTEVPNNPLFYTVEDASSTNGNLVSLSFTQAGLAYLKTQGDKSLVVTFTAKVSSIGSGTSAGIINNTAYFDTGTVVATTPPTDENIVPPVTNPTDPEYPGQPGYPGTPTNEVTTNWGDVKLKKVNASNPGVGLAGAEFKVYTIANPYTAPTGNATASSAVGSAISVTPTAGGQSTDTFSSTTGGVVTIPGLFVSDSENPSVNATSRWYVVQETKAPTGYVLPTGDAAYHYVEVKTGATPAGTYDAASITNTQQAVPGLPLTGAQAQMVMIMIGIALLLVALGIVLVTRRRRAQHRA
jgi:fimbrial isopeptide formation D2 family protein/LPXTG-motif cell wall-anchored protein